MQHVGHIGRPFLGCKLHHEPSHVSLVPHMLGSRLGREKARIQMRGDEAGLLHRRHILLLGREQTIRQRSDAFDPRDSDWRLNRIGLRARTSASPDTRCSSATGGAASSPPPQAATLRAMTAVTKSASSRIDGMVRERSFFQVLLVERQSGPQKLLGPQPRTGATAREPRRREGAARSWHDLLANTERDGGIGCAA